MKKRIFSRVLALFMALSLSSSTALAAQVLTQDNLGTFTDTTTGALLAHDGTGNVATSESERYYDYYLGGDIMLDKTLVVNDGVEANIDLNGHTLQLNEWTIHDNLNPEGYHNVFEWRSNVPGAVKPGPVIRVTGDDTSLTVMDKVMDEGAETRGTEIGTITGSNSGGIGGGAGVYVDGGSEFTLSGGKITKNTSRGVQVENATFNMTGGIICDNKQNATGGGVSVGNKATFNMSGGEITHNWAGSSGGGVLVVGATFNMSGGKIADNGTRERGGAVYVGTDGTLTMSGGEISGNKVTTQKGPGGGAISTRYKGTFEMTGGKIVNNTSASYGGAVAVDMGGNFKMADGEISGNTASIDGSVMSIFTGNYTNNGITVSFDREKQVIGVTDSDGNYMEYALDCDDDSHITAGDIPEKLNWMDWNKVLYLRAPSSGDNGDGNLDGNDDNGTTPDTTPDAIPDTSIPLGDLPMTTADTTTIEDEETPLAGIVTLADLLNALWEYEGIEEVELPEDFKWLDHDYAQAIYWGLDEALVVDTEDDPLDPDEIVTVALLREVLENFVEYKGVNLTVAVEGEDDMIVMDLGERLTVFYGELEAALEAQAA